MRNKINQYYSDDHQSLQFQTLNEQQCEKIVSTAKNILANTGISMKNERARTLLADHGCTVEGTHVKIPTELFDRCLKTAPSEVTIYDQKGNEALKLNARNGRSYFVPGMCNVYRIDTKTGERRLCVKQDALDTAILVESLPHIDVACGLTLLSDCEEELAAAYEVRELLKGTTKPVLLMSTNLLEIETSYKLCCAVAGGEENFQKKPFAIAGADCASPLTHNAANVDTILYMFEKGIPTPYIAAPMIGATGPVTLAGSLALALADSMVGMVLSQLVNPGCPFIGTCFLDIMDMSTTSFAMTAPELSLAAAASVDLYRYLNLPNVCHMGMTDAITFDQQAAMDLTIQMYTSMLSGSNLNFFGGFLETAMTGSLEALYFCNDTIGFLDHIIGGLEVSEETLAFDVIDEVGPEGNFLSEEHTVEHYTENWRPSGALARQNWTTYNESGCKNYQTRANEQINHILEQGIQEPKSEEILTSMDQILENAVAKLNSSKI